MENLFFRVLIVSAAVSVVLLPLLALLPRWQRRYAAHTRKAVWLAVTLALLVVPLLPKSRAPIQLEAPQSAVTLPTFRAEAPEAGTPQLGTSQGTTQPESDAVLFPTVGQNPGLSNTTSPQTPSVDGNIPTPARPARTIRWSTLFAALWLAGGAAVLLWQLAAYLLARRKLMGRAIPVDDHAALAEEFCPGRQVRFFRVDGLETPMTMGLTRPVVLLPEGFVPQAAIRHELVHIRRWDVGYKVLLLIACAVHWFDPLVWLMARRAGRDVEASCDAAVVAGSDAEARREYGALLLQSAARRDVPFTTQFGGGKGQMKARLYELFHPGKRSRVLVAGVLVVCLLAGSVVASSSGGNNNSRQATEEEAFDLLEESITYENGLLSFTIPDMETPTQSWSINVAGLAEYPDGMSMSVHYFNAADRTPGETYSEQITNETALALTELNMELTLGEATRTIDLLPLIRANDTLFVDKGYGYALRLPDSWAGKYTVQERATNGPGHAVYFYQRDHGDNAGLLLTLFVESADALREAYPGMSDQEIMDASPVQMTILGETGGYIVSLIFTSDVQYDTNNAALTAEYLQMDADIRALTPAAFILLDGMGDKPTIPANAAEGIEYLYDFTFSERYDSRRSADFSLIMPGNTGFGAIALYEKYRNEAIPDYSDVLDGDGMVPHSYRRYWYTLSAGENLFLETDYYEPDGVEYISCVWTNMEGAATNRGVAVGSTEADLLSAYPDDLYYMDKTYAEPRVADADGRFHLEFTFEYTYVWQPFTPETNEIRDITFYMKDGKVVSIEVFSPYELRYVYGYDRQAGLQTANEKRAALSGEPEKTDFRYVERTGRTAVLLEDAFLTACYGYSYRDPEDYSTYAWYYATEPLGPVLNQGDIVLVLGEEGGWSRVVIPYGDAPWIYGRVISGALSTDPADIANANQAIITDCDCYDAVGGRVVQTTSARVEILAHSGEWVNVQLLGTGEAPCWVRASQLSFDFDQTVIDSQDF